LKLRHASSTTSESLSIWFQEEWVGRLYASFRNRIIIIIIIIITTTIFIVLSSTALAICESSLWFIWAKVGQR